MDDKLRATLEKIKILASQNKEFDAELRKMYGGNNTSSAVGVSIPNETIDDVKVIRNVMEIRANASVSYNFIKEKRLRDQLLVDNLRMENSALDLQKNENERFYNFCVNAFYQLENILNYYYHKTFPDIKDLLAEIEYYTKDEMFKFTRSGYENNVSDITASHKMNAFCNKMFPHDTIQYTLTMLRKVRNEGEHRCMVIQDKKDKSNSLYTFLESNTFNSVRIILMKVVNKVEESIGKPDEKVSNIVDATISQLLPSGCFVTFNGKTKQLPYKLLPNVKGKNIGDNIRLRLLHGNIDAIDTTSSM